MYGYFLTMRLRVGHPMLHILYKEMFIYDYSGLAKLKNSNERNLYVVFLSMYRLQTYKKMCYKQMQMCEWHQQS